ncbi:MAG: CapA family protein [Armatimonadetes bacterium]|nr:CapA family protein [Armatimonadota bacterium]
MPTLALTGDVMLGRGVNEALRHMRPEDPWGDLLPLLAAADARIINLECALTDHRQPWMRTPKVFHFRADPSAIAVLQAARTDACSLANNHVLDYEEQGLLDTLAHLDAAGISHAGAGRNLEEALRPALFDAAGECVGFVAFTDNEPDWAAGPDHPGTAYLPVSLEPAVLGRVEAAIAAARQAGAQTVVFSNHWGPNMAQRPSGTFRCFARAVMDRGADLYYGHSAHIFQGVEVYRGKPILYDTGDLIDDYAVDPMLRNDWSFLFQVVLEKGALCRLELFPVALSHARAHRAAGEVRTAIMDRMARLSAGMGTAFERRADRLVLRA